MRQLRRCMLVVLCVCVMGALTGCGNDNADNKATDYNGDRTNDATNGTADDTKMMMESQMRLVMILKTELKTSKMM